MTFEEFPGLTLIESIHVTSLRTKSRAAIKRKAHIAMYQEAKIPTHEEAQIKNEFAEAKWTLQLGPLDP